MSEIPRPRNHGGDGARVAAAFGLDPAAVLDLSASLNPLARDIAPLARAHLDELARYPDPTDATAVLAQAMDVDPARLLLTNGGSEAITLVANAVGGTVEEPEFSLHPRGGGPRWRSNPHNPTGRLAGVSEQADVWDEAFYPLATGAWTRGDQDSVVVGSLTKLFACPGVRLGYVLGEPDLVERLGRDQPEWSVNGLALAVLPELLEGADLPGWCKEIGALRDALHRLLLRFGLEPLDSDANFILCARAQGLRDRLAPQGVVVRDCASFGLEGHARIAVPNEEGLLRLERALELSQ